MNKNEKKFILNVLSLLNKTYKKGSLLNELNKIIGNDCWRAKNVSNGVKIGFQRNNRTYVISFIYSYKPNELNCVAVEYN
jgi:hypothetical protein